MKCRWGRGDQGSGLKLKPTYRSAAALACLPADSLAGEGPRMGPVARKMGAEAAGHGAQRAAVSPSPACEAEVLPTDWRNSL